MQTPSVFLRYSFFNPQFFFLHIRTQPLHTYVIYFIGFCFTLTVAISYFFIYSVTYGHEFQIHASIS